MQISFFFDVLKRLPALLASAVALTAPEWVKETAKDVYKGGEKRGRKYRDLESSRQRQREQQAARRRERARSSQTAHTPLQSYQMQLSGGLQRAARNLQLATTCETFFALLCVALVCKLQVASTAAATAQ